MKIDKAVSMLIKEYEFAKNKVWVHKPIAYALYKVWKFYEENELPRNISDRLEDDLK